jgi:hypothetical protein
MRRLLLILAAAVAFGVVMAVVKGQADDARNALGNMSAPWIVVPFLAGSGFARARHGALAGIVATLAAFAGFYVAEAVILDLGPHPWSVDLRLAAGTINVYERAGVLSGALYGALGTLWATGRVRAAALAVGFAFVVEPLVVLALWRGNLWGGPGILRFPALWIGEIVLGVILAAALFRRRGAIT